MKNLNSNTMLRSVSKIFGTTMIIGMLVFSTSCKKGDTGPAGTNGKDGNANVVSSTITSSNWVYTSPSWKIDFTYPAITQSIIDNGAVLVYLQVGSAYNQLPLTTYPSSTYSRTYEVSSYVGGVAIYATDSDLTQPANPGSKKFKVVVIAASGLKQNPNVNLDNYEEVKAAFNIQD